MGHGKVGSDGKRGNGNVKMGVGGKDGRGEKEGKGKNNRKVGHGSGQDRKMSMERDLDRVINYSS